MFSLMVYFIIIPSQSGDVVERLYVAAGLHAGVAIAFLDCFLGGREDAYIDSILIVAETAVLCICADKV